MTKFATLACLLAGIAVHAATAQTGLLVVAHGADSGWNAQVRRTVSQVHWPDGPLRVAFLMGSEAQSASFDRGAHELVAAGATRIIVVPLMISSFGSHSYDIAAATHGEPMTGMGHDHGVSTSVTVPMQVTAALDSAPELGQALLGRWLELSPSDRQRPLVLVAHGPNDDADAARWIANITAATRSLASRLPDRVVHVGLLRDDAPPEVRSRAVRGIRDTISALSGQRRDSVMVMTVLISSGSINTIVVPHDLAGMPMKYFGAALAPSEPLAGWIERMGRGALAVSPLAGQR